MDGAAAAFAAPAAAMPPLTGAKCRRQEPLTDGAPMPFNPLPVRYVPPRSCEDAFIALCPTSDHPDVAAAAWANMVPGIEFKAQRVRNEVGAARGQSLDEVFAITALTADPRVASPVFGAKDSLSYRLNEILRRRDVAAFAPFADYFAYLRSALGKIPPQATTVWRGLKGVTLENPGLRCKAGHLLCLAAFTFVTTDSSVLEDVADGGVMLKVQATEALSIAEYALFPTDEELLLAPNSLLRIDTALSAARATEEARLRGPSLPRDVALIVATQKPTTMPIVPQKIALWRIPRNSSHKSIQMYAMVNRPVLEVAFAEHAASDDIVRTVAQHCPQLTALNVSDSDDSVTDESITAVAQRCPQLTALNVSSTYGNVTDASITGVARFCAQLTTLNVGYTDGNVTDASIAVVAQHCPHLTALNVCGTKGAVTDASITAVAQRCPHLTALDVSSTDGNVTDESIAVVAQHCPHLTALDVSTTDGMVTDESITAVAQRCPQLTALHVSNTGGAVTVASIAVVRRMVPLCEVYGPL